MDETASTANLAGKKRQLVSLVGARSVFWIMFGISFINYLDRYILTGAANVIAKELGFRLDGIGFITSAFLIVYTLAVLPLGLWADRARRKDIVALCVAIWSVATSLTALAGSFFTLFLSRMALGIGEAGYYPAGTALMSDYFNREQRSRIMSFWGMAELFGILGGYGIGGAVAGLYHGSWRLAFLITGIPGLLLAFLAWKRIREPRRNEADEQAATLAREAGAEILPREVALPPAALPPAALPVEQQEPFLRRLWAQSVSLLHIKTLVVLTLVQVFAFFVLGVNVTFLPTYLQQKDIFGMSSGLAGLYSGGIIVLAGLIGSVAGGYAADWLDRRHAGARVLVCGICFLLSVPTYALAITLHNIWLFSLFFVLTALLLRAYNGPCSAATQDVTPAVLRASAMGISLLIAHLFGDAAAPALVGTLATFFDPTHGGHFAASMAGQDLSRALLITCVPALLIAGLIGIFGARWMGSDVIAAKRADDTMSTMRAEASYVGREY
ncbi:MAG TPA: MFS transporter [Ktedonobacteraceae bacterium]|nr:MFS transporter [Ktedonobacteraceae bacterium]